MNIIIVGCGKTGSRLASKLDELGFDISVVDSDVKKFEFLSDSFSGLCVCGKETDIDVLKNAGCDNADIAVVATHSDNINIMAAQIFETEFGIDEIYVRLLDPSREAVFKKFGLHTVCATRLESDIFLNLITKTADDIQSVTVGDVSVHFTEKKAEKRDVGKALHEIVCRQNESVFAVKKENGSVFLRGQYDGMLCEGDVIVYAVM